MDPNIVTPGVNPAIPTSTIPQPTKKFNLKILLIALGIIIALFLLAAGISVAIAYEKVSFNQPKIERPIRQFIIDLPFAPKTPKYVLTSSALAHKEVATHSFDISLATKSDSLTPAFGLDQLDIRAKGAVDYSDSKNVKFFLDADFTKDLNLSVRKKDKIIYFKINKLPELLLSTIGVRDSTRINKALENWIGFDSTPLDTEARRKLDSNSEEKSITKEFIDGTLDNFLDEKVLKSIKMSTESLDGLESYKLILDADKETIDYLGEKINKEVNEDNSEAVSRKLSETVKSLEITLWIDKDRHFVRKVETSFRMVPPPYGLTPSLEDTSNLVGGKQSEVSVVGVVRLSDFGTQIGVDTPDQYMKPEEFLRLFYSEMGYGGVDLNNSSASSGDMSSRSRDAARLTDLANLQQAINITIQESNLPKVRTLCWGDLDKRYPCFGSSLTDGRDSDGRGWVKVNLNSSAVSIPTLPKDPTNNKTFHYFYCANADGWEINAVLESIQYASKMPDDGGDNPGRYEIGSNLSLIDKTAGCTF